MSDREAESSRRHLSNTDGNIESASEIDPPTAPRLRFVESTILRSLSISQRVRNGPRVHVASENCHIGQKRKQFVRQRGNDLLNFDNSTSSKLDRRLGETGRGLPPRHFPAGALCRVLFEIYVLAPLSKPCKCASLLKLESHLRAHIGCI